MKQVRRILFPIAFSKAAESMAPSVRETAERFKAAVTLLNAFNPLPEYLHGPFLEDRCTSKEEPLLPYSPALLKLRDRQKERLEAFSRDHFSGITCSTRIEDGDPAMVIEWLAKCEKSDLIMMPTRGLGRFRRLLLGSVTSKILHDTAVPVWTSIHNPELSSDLPHGCHSILCAVGMKDGLKTAFKAACLFARTYHANLCLLHVKVPMDVQNRRPLDQSVMSSFQRLCAVVGTESAPDVRVRILDGEISKGIRQTAIEEHADLLIVGRGHTRESLGQVWSHLYTIIRESPCPVLSV